MASGIIVWFWRTMAILLMVETTLGAPALANMYSSRLIHRFSDELRVFSRGKTWPELKSKEYYHMMLVGDFQRQKMKFSSHQRQHQLVFPYQGGQTQSFGNELGWLHYTWIDIGTPSMSFLVGVDDGSDLLWVPCDCVQCAPLSAHNYNSLDKDLNEYDPAGSSSSKHLPCNHQLCELGSNCKSHTEPCPYFVKYFSENTTSSGLLVEDVLHLSSSGNNQSDAAVQASIIFGCGKKQSGDYLEGIAPDGLMGLGLGKQSVPSFLAKSGLVRDSFSLCFDDDGSGRIFFGDQGLSSHHWTPLLPLDGKYSTYIVGVEALCIGKKPCLKQTSFNALIDSGTSFTFLPANVYKKLVAEFDSQVSKSRATFDGYLWDYCYKSSDQEALKHPSLELVLAANGSYLVQNPVIPVVGQQGVEGFCLAVQPVDSKIAIIGQNFMIGYHLVFDRENMKIGWSSSDCQDKRLPPAPPTHGSPNPLPTDEQSMHGGHAVAPAIAGRAPPSRASTASSFHTSSWVLLSKLFSSIACFHLLCNLEYGIALGSI